MHFSFDDTSIATAGGILICLILRKYYEESHKKSLVFRVSVERIKAYVLGGSDRPLILHGASGCGKTSLMAKGASQVTRSVV